MRRDINDLRYDNRNTKYSVASENYTEKPKEYDEEQLQKREAKRKVQGFETHDQIAEWAPEFPEDVRTWMRFIGGDRTIKLESTPEFAKTQLRCIGELFYGSKRTSKAHYQRLFEVQVAGVQAESRQMAIVEVVLASSRLNGNSGYASGVPKSSDEVGTSQSHLLQSYHE